MNAIVPQNFGPVSKRFVDQQMENDLAAGISASYAIMGYKGKVWSTRYRGEERTLLREDGDGPRGSIEVVVLKANAHLSKIFYENGYQEGSSAPPDCFSNNGVSPDPSAAKKQANTCATCPRNAWGSRITPAGKNGKACSDSKRIAIAPLGDIANDALGGPMLLRVPAASLNELAAYGMKMQQMGYPYNSVGTRISFDPKEAYPKFVFTAIRPLSDAEAELVLAMASSPQVARVLAEADISTPPAAPLPPPESVFEQPPAPKPAPAPQAVAAPAPVAPPAPEPEPAPVKRAYKKQAAAPAPAPEPEAPAGEFEDDLDAALDNLLPR
jgi:hypothetical protein